MWSVAFHLPAVHAFHDHRTSRFCDVRRSTLNASSSRQRASLFMKVIVVTGGSKGIGFELSREFARHPDGHTVVIGARSTHDLEQAKSLIQKSAEGTSSQTQVLAFPLDVSNDSSIESFVQSVVREAGKIDIWVNNAGSNAYARKPIFEQTGDQVAVVVDTNTKGTLLCCRQAIIQMRKQSEGGHIFNCDGAGVGGNGTPGYAAYGATKRSMPQIMKSLNAELSKAGIKNVGVHTISPGLVLTDLLLAGSTAPIRVFLNLLAEEPDTVAKWLVPRILATTGKGKYHKFLTIPGAFAKMATGLVLRQNRYFDMKGNRVIKSPRDEFDDKGVRLRR